MRLLIFIFITVFCLQGTMGQIIYSPEDSIRFEEKLTQIRSMEAFSLGDSLTIIGMSFLGTPYVEKTLEVGPTESLVINLRGLDCTTFVENVLAFGSLMQQEEMSFSGFAENLKTIRYRNGKLNNYSSRLHYFTEWIRNNEHKGLVQDITSKLGGEIVEKPINFMGTHRKLYPFLADDFNFGEILRIESELANESLCILPQDQIEAQEYKIKNGDIIALATSIKGLDVTHTGIAIRKNDRIHLLHASISGSVTITDIPLVDYLKKIKSNVGIIVARPTLISTKAP